MCPAGHFEKVVYIGRTFFFLFFRLSAQNFLQLSQLHGTCPEKDFEEKDFFDKILFLYLFLHFERKFLHCRRIFCRRCVNCTLGVQRNLLEKIVSLRENSDFNEVFLHLKKESFWLLVKFSVKILKTAFYVSRRICWRKVFSSERNSVFNFLSEFGRKFFCRVVKTAFYVSSGTFRKNCLHWKDMFFQFFFFQHKISRSCHNCMVHVQRNILREKIFLVKL